MNILLIASDHLAHFDLIQGQHRLNPVKLSDGSGFLSADCLTEPHFVEQLADVPYTLLTFADIQHLIIQSEV